MLRITPSAIRPALLGRTCHLGVQSAHIECSNFALTDTTDLVPVNVKAASVEYKGRKAVLITRYLRFRRPLRASEGRGLPGWNHRGRNRPQDHLPAATAGSEELPGFIGVAFRARPDASHYDLFLLAARKLNIR